MDSSNASSDHNCTTMIELLIYDQPIKWFWPFSTSPTLESGLHFETNGFEDSGTSWPPPDPDKMAHYRPGEAHSSRVPVAPSASGTTSEFRRRQHEDYRRRGIFREENLSSLTIGSTHPSAQTKSPQDFGVDEQADDDEYGCPSDD